MDRREFLKAAGLGAAAAGLVACAPKTLVEESGAKTDKGLEGTMPQHYPGVGLLGYGCMRWPMVDGTDGKKHIAQEEVNRLGQLLRHISGLPGGRQRAGHGGGAQPSPARELAAGHKAFQLL